MASRPDHAASRYQVLEQELPAQPRPAPAAAPLPAVRGFLDDVLEATAAVSAASAPAPSRASSLLRRFLDEPDPWRALLLWLGEPAVRANPDRRELALLLTRDVALLDGLLSEQVNAVLHHPRFQKLEASWRGLRYLVDQVEEGANVKVRVLNVSWRELVKDAERAIEFDQSQLFQKVYSEEFGTPGGEPFGVLLGDYEIHARPGADHPHDDLGALASISHVAAAAFAPFVAAPHPSLLGLDSFAELEHTPDLARTFEELEFLKWRSLRGTEDARFAALVLPRVLLRLPYENDGSRADGFAFREDVANPDRSGYLWGNACYAFGAVLIRTFGESGWLAAIHGVQRGVEAGGLVTGLPAPSFATDRPGVALQGNVEAALTDLHERELTELGLLPLCACPGTSDAAFYSSQSIQQPRKFDAQAATTNARLSSMLQYMLSVSRFAHYVKVIARDKVGAMTTPAELEELLTRWLATYVIADDEAGPEVKARFPLREGRVEIREHPGKPGSFVGAIHLRPHFQLDEVVTSIRLTTELSAPQGR